MKIVNWTEKGTDEIRNVPKQSLLKIEQKMIQKKENVSLSSIQGKLVMNDILSQLPFLAVRNQNTFDLVASNVILYGLRCRG